MNRILSGSGAKLHQELKQKLAGMLGIKDKDECSFVGISTPYTRHTCGFNREMNLAPGCGIKSVVSYRSSQ